MRTEKEIHVETKYRLVFEDEGFLVVEKPAPLPVHPVGRFTEKNLLSILKKDRPELAEGFRIVNRLDSETSGLVIVAKSSFMAGRLGILFEKRLVKKEYQAVVAGVPRDSSKTIRLSLGTVHRGPIHMRKADPEGESAVTHYHILKRGKDAALLCVRPETGRKHQIRAHLSFIGHPVLGDKIYMDSRVFERYIQGGWEESMRNSVRSERLLLHASLLEFPHPVSGETRVFKSDVPEFFLNFLDSSFRRPMKILRKKKILSGIKRKKTKRHSSEQFKKPIRKGKSHDRK